MKPLYFTLQLFLCNLLHVPLGVYSESCDGGGRCIDTNVERCEGMLKKGYCSGASNIICCEPPVSCDGGHGVCVDSTLQTCDGTLRTGYCPGAANILCCEPPIDYPERCLGSGPKLLENSYLFTLQSQGFPSHPGALVYVPSLFDTKSSDIELIIYIHGYNNCVSNIVRNSQEACNCTVGADIREAYNLIEQFEKATIATQRSNQLFVAAEVAYDQANDSPGRWSEPGLFKAFVDELLAVHMAPYIGQRSASDVVRTRIFSHSGGYYVIGNMAAVGGVASVRDLTLFDSLYADMVHFDAFVQDNLPAFGTTASEYRFSSVYTADGGTYSNNQAMAQRAAGWVATANRTEVMILDNSVGTLSLDTIGKFSLLFKYSSLTHDNIPRNMFYDFLVAGA